MERYIYRCQNEKLGNIEPELLILHQKATHAKWNTATISHILTCYDNWRGETGGFEGGLGQPRLCHATTPSEELIFMSFGFCFLFETKNFVHRTGNHVKCFGVTRNTSWPPLNPTPFLLFLFFIFSKISLIDSIWMDF